jgi:ACS family allantoate permease-like MFS transporter
MDPLQAHGWSSEKAEKHPHGVTVATEDVDTGATLVAGISDDLDPVEVA